MKRKLYLLLIICALILLVLLWKVLPPSGGVALGLLATCAVIYWLGGVLTDAIDRVWRQR